MRLSLRFLPVSLQAAALATLALGLAAGGCDPRTSNGVSRADVTGGSPAQSQEHETCSATGDCEAPLRCVEAQCRRPVTSRLGEYHWAAAELALGKGQLLPALASFQDALGQFEAARLAPPPELLCHFGQALRRKTGDAVSMEQAARHLHRCLLASAAGSSEHTLALRELAELEVLGLDPALLARDTPADKYLTRSAARPSSDAVKVEVAQTVPSKVPGYAAWIEAAQGAEARAGLVTCWEKYWSSTQKTKLTVVVPVRFQARYDEEEEEFRGGVLNLDPAPDAQGAEAAASTCAREALAEAAEAFGKKARGASFTGTITLLVGSGS